MRKTKIGRATWRKSGRPRWTALDRLLRAKRLKDRSHRKDGSLVLTASFSRLAERRHTIWVYKLSSCGNEEVQLHFFPLRINCAAVLRGREASRRPGEARRSATRRGGGGRRRDETRISSRRMRSACSLDPCMRIGIRIRIGTELGFFWGISRTEQREKVRGGSGLWMWEKQRSTN